MNTSIELLSSMSPKITANFKYGRKAPATLALKKYFRKSLSTKNIHNLQTNVSVITVSSCSVSLSSESEELLNETPIVISDESDASFEETSPTKNVDLDNKDVLSTNSENTISLEKYRTIQHWVDNVNSSNQDDCNFSEVSLVFGDDNSGLLCPKTNIAASSTLLNNDAKRFDEIFTNKRTLDSKMELKQNAKQYDNNTIFFENGHHISQSEYSNDSFNLVQNEDIILTKQSYNNIENESNHQEDFDKHEFLDNSGSLRSKKENPIMPLSESRITVRKKITKQIPQTERPVKKKTIINNNNGSNFLKNFQKAQFQKTLKSPWIESLKRICDSDTESNDSENCNVLHLVKLHFEETTDIGSNSPSDSVNKKTEDKVSSESELGVLKNKTQRKLYNNYSVRTKSQKKRFKKPMESPFAEPLRRICNNGTNSNDSEDSKKHLTPIKLNFEDCASDGYHSTNKKKGTRVFTKQNSQAITFLASLSDEVPLEKCDLSAKIFRTDYQQHKEVLVRKLFHLYNEKVFQNSVPANTKIEWNDRLRDTAGKCIYKYRLHSNGTKTRTVAIILSKKVLDSPDRLRDTLIHEMCHAATWIVNGVSEVHGSVWKSWASCAMKTFPELPQIEACHNYVVKTKYSYKCSKCGYIIGRHTKSLNVQSTYCHHCYGKFDIFINKITKRGETKSVPVTPQKPNKFALFVKENYATYKTPNFNHGDVMTILSQMFAELKKNKDES